MAYQLVIGYLKPTVSHYATETPWIFFLIIDFNGIPTNHRLFETYSKPLRHGKSMKVFIIIDFNGVSTLPRLF